MMAEGADSGSANPAKRKQSAERKSRLSLKKSSSSRVSLEKVLGISTSSSSGLTCNPKSGLIAYPAGCVIVLLHPKKNKQSHIINTSRKPFSTLAFSHDGKHLVTGESGHMPCVRVWELGGGQVAEVQTHKYGVSCVAFSTNSCYIVSVGYQHDMTVSVWDWRKGAIIASNKVSSRVLAVSFSQDNSYFVTAGNRHLKFWYLDASKERRVNSTVPLIGRSGLLGDHKNSMFSGVACGRGLMASSTYSVTSSGLLCLFNRSRNLEAWVDLKTAAASCLVVSEDLIFCGCADGAIRVFTSSGLQYVSTLQRPHRLGVDLMQSTPRGPPPDGPARYPDTLAVTFDPAARLLTSVYNDHSVYVWDVRDVRSAWKLYSALYHSSCVWSVEVYPELSDVSLAPSSFLTCSSDNTIRLWHTDPPTGLRNQYSHDLQRILYVGENTKHLQAESERGGEAAAGADGKAGIRVLSISPDGQHLAAGDRCGNLRIFGLEFLDQLVKIEAHDSEVLCLDFSPTATGVKLLASASRDRLIHIFNLEKNYTLEQTLSDHSASITAVKFTGHSPQVGLVSCGADKSIYFMSAEQVEGGLRFSRRHHVVEKTTLYDMDLDSSRTHVSVACQDRNVRVYNVETGKLKKCLKGSSSDEGALLKVQMDPSGSFFATSCSDKNISIFDYETGECVATLLGHSEIVTCMRFSPDCRHLITASGDSCVFVWRLDSQMTSTMRRRRGLKLSSTAGTCRRNQQSIRRETFITGPSSQCPQMEEEEEEADLGTPARPDCAQDAQLLQTNGKLPMWFRKLQGQGGASTAAQSAAEPHRVRNRWAEHPNPLTICANLSPSPTKSQEAEEEDEKEEEGEEEDEEEDEEEEDEDEDEGDFHPQSLESLLGNEEEEEEEIPGDISSYILHPNTTSTHREVEVGAVTFDPQQEVKGHKVWSAQLSPDSACSEGSAGSTEQQQDADTDSLSQGSSVGSSVLEDEEEDDNNSLKNHFDTLSSSLSNEKFDTDLRALQPNPREEEKDYLNPRLSISTRFLSRFQDRIRVWPSRAPPPVSIPSRISEGSGVSDTSVTSEPRDGASTESPRNPGNNVKRSHSVLCRTASSIISHQPLRRPTRRRRHSMVVVQCREALRDVTSSGQVTSSAQQGALLGYLGTTASSRAKLIQDPPPSPPQGEEKENVCSSDLGSPAGLDPHEDQTSSLRPSSRQPTASPAVMSQGGVSRLSSVSSVSSVEETLTSHNQTFTLSPCDLMGGAGSHSRGPTEMDAPPSSSSSPLVEKSRPFQPGEEEEEEEESVSLQQCQQVANELRQTARRAVHLYQQLGVADRCLQMSAVLEGAFAVVHAELQALLQGGGAPSAGGLQDEGTASLLEKYSELLVQMTQNKLKRL
ncbi:WD repeat-containing protein 62 isoform X1 [Pungitius pungitius]|uniref:WD repeat-containing protein 62 isoform X1 n=1 Tax=Pungitius pungitius TaxID=134920 RepID=UPI002E14C114